MIHVKQRENLIIEFAGQAPEYDCIAIGCSFHDLIESFCNVRFVADFNFVNSGVLIVFIKMLCQAIDAHLPNFGNSFFFVVADHKRGHQIFPVATSVHHKDRDTIDWRENCTNDIHKGVPHGNCY